MSPARLDCFLHLMRAVRRGAAPKPEESSEQYDQKYQRADCPGFQRSFSEMGPFDFESFYCTHAPTGQNNRQPTRAQKISDAAEKRVLAFHWKLPRLHKPQVYP